MLFNSNEQIAADQSGATPEQSANPAKVPFEFAYVIPELQRLSLEPAQRSQLIVLASREAEKQASFRIFALLAIVLPLLCLPALLQSRSDYPFGVLLFAITWITLLLTVKIRLVRREIRKMISSDGRLSGPT